MKPAGMAGFAVAVILALAIAAYALWQNGRDATPPDMARPMFPDLKAHEGDIARVEITGAGNRVIIARQGQDAWVLPGKNSYPADPAKVAEVLATAENLTLLEQKTADPARYADLGLADPVGGEQDKRKSKGAGNGIRFLDASGKLIAGLVFGNMAPSLGRLGGGIYARREGDPATWLAEGTYQARPQELDWADRQLFPFEDPQQISRVAIDENGKTILTLARTGTGQDITVTPPLLGKPDSGQELRLIGSLASLTFNDMKPAPAEEPKPSRTLSFTDAAGVTYVLKLIGNGKAAWAAATQQGGDKAAEFNALHGKWLYRLPDYQLDVLEAPLKDFVAKPEATKSEAAKPAPASGERK